MKSKFLLNEFFNLSISGALQRANVYTKTADSNAKEDFKKDLRNYLNTLVEPYFSPVSGIEHVSSIEALSTFSMQHDATLKNGSLNFGVSQHILNLFLKYIWCLKLIPAPPHFPIDGKIQDQLNREAEKLNLQVQRVHAWTKIKDPAAYLKIVNFATDLKNSSGNESLSLAEYELAFYLKPS